ncbi:hypothetical protein QBZ16_002776 [Prototheca wickerhamii]|uniref:BACK domain-containing protein n=1 Tax=Prototheca wickerhamii TaxID=3111 RepID=A0AAD9III2_PROWI|nr:hypothetical protein QBZ16_002776 [Prototheca wickerhamii]
MWGVIAAITGASIALAVVHQTVETHSTTAAGSHPESNYTVILGSHRNSCLKIEKNGALCSMARDVALARLPNGAFERCWVNIDGGDIAIGVGEPGTNVSHVWRDPEPIDGIAYAGLSAWDSHVIYRGIQVLPALARLEMEAAAEPGAADGPLADAGSLSQEELEAFGSPLRRPSLTSAGSVPTLLALAARATEEALSPATAPDAAEVAEALRHAVPALRATVLDYAAANLDAVLDVDAGQALARALSAPALADLLQRQRMAVRSEFRLFQLVAAWAAEGFDLLPHVRFPLMTAEELQDVQAHPLWRTEPLLRLLVAEALSGGTEICHGQADEARAAVSSTADPLASPKSSFDQASVSITTIHRTPLQEAALTSSAPRLPTALEAAASARYQPRSPPSCTELMFVCAGDDNGALHWLGTRPWVNPARSGAVRAWASSPACRSTRPEGLTAPGPPKLNFAAPRADPGSGRRAAFWALDLGPRRALACAAYTLRHDTSRDFLRSWRLQGAVDDPAAPETAWHDLRTHAGDGTLRLAGQWGAWRVLGRAAAARFRAFRVLIDEPQVGNDNPWHVSLAQIELYGQLFEEGAESASMNGG